MDASKRLMVGWPAADHLRRELVEEVVTIVLLQRGSTPASDHCGLFRAAQDRT